MGLEPRPDLHRDARTFRSVTTCGRSFLRENADAGVQAGRTPMTIGVASPTPEASTTSGRSMPCSRSCGRPPGAPDRQERACIRAGDRRAVRQTPGHHVQLRVLGPVPGRRAARTRTRATRSITSAVTFSTDIAPLVRAGLVAGLRRRRARHVQRRRRWHRGDDRAPDEGDARPQPHRQRPDWDAIRAIADEHGLRGRRGLLRCARDDSARHAHRYSARTSR